MAVLFLMGWGLFAFHLAASTEIDWNGIRLAAPVAFAKGMNIFFRPGEGPWLSGVNGPVQVLLHSPAALFEDPALAIQFAALLSALTFFVPAALLIRRLTPPANAAEAILAFFFVVIILPPLRLSSFLVHGDAPMLGLGILAFLLANSGQLLWAALVATLSLHAKSSGILFVLSLPCLVGLWYGRLAVLRFGIQLSACLVTTTMGFQWVFGPGIFNSGFGYAWVTSHLVMPSALLSAAGELLWYPLGLWIASLFFPSKAKPFFYLALIAVPVAVLGRARWGGDWNTLSVCLYPLAVGFAVLFADLPRASSRVALCLLAVWAVHRSRPVFLLSYPGAEAHRASVSFIRLHPDESFFPFHPLSHVMGEEKLYHSWEAIRDVSRHSVITKQEFHRHFPDKWRWIAYLDRSPSGMESYLDSSHPTDLAALTGWTVFERDGRSARDFARFQSPPASPKVQ